MQAKESGLGYRIEWEDTLYLVPTPIVRLNSLNQWHSDTLPGIEWKGGEKFFYLNGVNFPHELWKKIISGMMPFEEILKIEDIDQRTQAMRFGDVDKFLEYTKAEKLDERIKFKPNGERVLYRLYKIPQGEIFTTDAYYLVYDCPSTDKRYMSGVGKCSTIAEAMAWKFEIKEVEWENLQPLLTES